MKTGISLIIHTKNEERNIKDCILSAKDIAEEMILMDMSSTDKTTEIAKSLSARIVKLPDVGFVDDFRNEGFSKAKFEWILTIDADERLTPHLIKKFLKIVRDDECDVVIAPRKNIRFNKWIRHGGWWPDNQWILFKKDYFKWPSNMNQAHMLPILKGRVLTLETKEENAFIHYNIENVNHLLSKIISYARLEGSGEFFNENEITPQSIISYYEGEFRYRYIQQKGYLDGMPGFISAKFREFFKFLEWAYWWERKGYPELVDKEKLKDAQFQCSTIFKIWRLYSKLKQLLYPR